MRRVYIVLFVVISAAYPLLVYAALGRFSPHWLALLLVAVAALRATIARQPFWWAVTGGTAVLAVLGFFADALAPLKLYPVLLNAVLLAVFAASLHWPPSAIERIARLRHPDLPPRGVAYTRKVTWLWCGFFTVNGALALITALWTDARIWALYNGLIAYGLMGLLFMGEWMVRRQVMQDKQESAHG
ncbi:MAG: hypothetical protein LBV61_02020 [Burkholderiaceae bacterium]|jgi:uncharacterized membrane protein|nr:hypothetical protein [Burkholderiaceae bacterium]